MCLKNNKSVSYFSCNLKNTTQFLFSFINSKNPWRWCKFTCAELVANIQLWARFPSRGLLMPSINSTSRCESECATSVNAMHLHPSQAHPHIPTIHLPVPTEPERPQTTVYYFTWRGFECLCLCLCMRLLQITTNEHNRTKPTYAAS